MFYILFYISIIIKFASKVAHLVAAVEGAQALRLVLVTPFAGSETGSTGGDAAMQVESDRKSVV